MDENDMHPGDVTLWLRQLESGDADQKEQARRQLDGRLAVMLKAAIGQRLGSLVRQRVGASDVYQELMKSFFLRLDRGDFDLPDSDALRALLYNMIRNKVINTRKHNIARNRDVRLEVVPTLDGEGDDDQARAEERAISSVRAHDEPANTRPYRKNLPASASDGRGDSQFAGKGVIELLTCGADQHDAAEAEEVYYRVKGCLNQHPPLEIVFDCVLAGISDEEIAKEIGKTVARVRQLMRQIRDRMEAIGITPDDQFLDSSDDEARKSG